MTPAAAMRMVLMLAMTVVLITPIRAELQLDGNHCFQPDPWDHARHTMVHCRANTATRTHHHAVIPRALAESTQASVPMQIDVHCAATVANDICEKVKASVVTAGNVFTQALVFLQPVRVNVSFMSFCAEMQVCQSTTPIPVALAKPTKLIPLNGTAADTNVTRLYPQALVKQLNLSSPPEYDPYDIAAYFNSDMSFWFKGDGTIGKDQPDFVRVAIHELVHGLGFASGWNDYSRQGLGILTPMPIGSNSDITDSKDIRLVAFLETIFDAHIVTLPDLTPLSASVKELQPFVTAGEQVRYADINDMYAKLIASSHAAAAQTVSKWATTPRRLGYLPPGATRAEEAYVLETALDPFRAASSLNHCDEQIYAGSRDFLMRYRNDDPRLMDDALRRSGAKSPLGPRLLTMFAGIGYRVNPDVLAAATASPGSALRDFIYVRLGFLRLPPVFIALLAIGAIMALF